ncbi:MAG: RNA polymerase sigma factor [Pelagimonas sp.]|uniref:RNA polymerase sigma factor n=1 Tax=Pelagimonas sp. TaxID=2073170 RepID=UPI003D6B523D
MSDTRRAYEEYLVAQVRMGREEAAIALVELRGPRLMLHATRLLGNHEEAQDAVQDAWIEVFKGLKGLRNDAAFPVWALRIVTRKCAQLIKGKQRDRSLARALAPVLPQVIEPPPGVSRDLARAIADLPAGQATAVALFYIEGLSVIEVSIALDIPVGTVKSRLSLARQSLKSALQGDHDA